MPFLGFLKGGDGKTSNSTFFNPHSALLPLLGLFRLYRERVKRRGRIPVFQIEAAGTEAQQKQHADDQNIKPFLLAEPKRGLKWTGCFFCHARNVANQSVLPIPILFQNTEYRAVSRSNPRIDLHLGNQFFGNRLGFENRKNRTSV